MNRGLLVLALLVAAGCREQTPPAPSAAEVEQLDEAEAMLNELGKEEGPEANAPGPSNRTD